MGKKKPYMVDIPKGSEIYGTALPLMKYLLWAPAALHPVACRWSLGNRGIFWLLAQEGNSPTHTTAAWPTVFSSQLQEMVLKLPCALFLKFFYLWYQKPILKGSPVSYHGKAKVAFMASGLQVPLLASRLTLAGGCLCHNLGATLV